MIDIYVIAKLSKMLGPSEALAIYALARKQEQLELKWVRNLKEVLRGIEKHAQEYIETSLELPSGLFLTMQLEKFFVDHGYDVFHSTVVSDHKKMPVVRMAKKKLPLEEIMHRWDRVKNGEEKVPKIIKDRVASIKADYLRALKKAWRRHSIPFTEGVTATKSEIIKKILEESRAPWARAKSIVETETTSGQNEARRAIYDNMDEVTHYMLAAIRDHRSSKWCKGVTTSEGRGRDGLVFTKGTELLRKNTPSLHPFCRSELLPLTPFNPRHKALIEDKGLRAENHKLTPLIKGWNE